MTNNPESISVLSCSCWPKWNIWTFSVDPSICPENSHQSLILLCIFHHSQIQTLFCLHENTTKYYIKYPDAALSVAGDFNKANRKQVMLNFFQYVTCPTKGVNTLDHCYTLLTGGYKATSFTAFGKADYVAIFLILRCIQNLKQTVPATQHVRCWSSQSVAILEDTLNDVDWDMFQSTLGSVNEFKNTVMSLTAKLIDDIVPTVSFKIFPNRKPWLDESICDAQNAWTAAYNSVLISGDTSLYKAESYKLWKAVKTAKKWFRTKVEQQLSDRDSTSM